MDARIIVISLVAGAGILGRMGPGLPACAGVAVSVALAAIAVRDADERIIPSGWLVFAAAVRIAFLVAAAAFGIAEPEAAPGIADGSGGLCRPDIAALPRALSGALLGAVIVGGLPALTGAAASAITARPALGGGDVKLFALAGLCLGWRGGLAVILLSCLLALPAAWCQRRADRRAGRPFDGTFPFGPAICLAFWLVLPAAW